MLLRRLSDLAIWRYWGWSTVFWHVKTHNIY